jgi:hypothetical protein
MIHTVVVDGFVDEFGGDRVVRQDAAGSVAQGVAVGGVVVEVKVAPSCRCRDGRGNR